MNILATEAGARSFAASLQRAGYSRLARTAFLLFTLLVILLPAFPAQGPPGCCIGSSLDPLPPSAGGSHVYFAFERPGESVPKYTLSFSESVLGEGEYDGEAVTLPSRAMVIQSAPQRFGSVFTISTATASRIFALTHKLNNFNIPCASKAKNIADTGKKTLTYAGPDGTSSCTYNYSEDKDVQTLTSLFQGIVETLDEGRELARLHRYDRLGLDGALAELAQQVSDGHALELGSIADTLRSIAADTEVMQRVQARAKVLLAKIPEESARVPPSRR
jgi:hypothetical protein